MEWSWHLTATNGADTLLSRSWHLTAARRIELESDTNSFQTSTTRTNERRLGRAGGFKWPQNSNRALQRALKTLKGWWPTLEYDLNGRDGWIDQTLEMKDNDLESRQKPRPLNWACRIQHQFSSLEWHTRRLHTVRWARTCPWFHRQIVTRCDDLKREPLFLWVTRTRVLLRPTEAPCIDLRREGMDVGYLDWLLERHRHLEERTDR
jgi:hypothetical protein